MARGFRETAGLVAMTVALAACGDPADNPNSGLYPTPSYTFETHPAVDPTMGCRDNRVGRLLLLGTVRSSDKYGSLVKRFGKNEDGTGVTSVSKDEWVRARHIGACVQVDFVKTNTRSRDLQEGEEFILHCAYQPTKEEELKLIVWDPTNRTEGMIYTNNMLEKRWRNGDYPWLLGCEW